MNKIFDLLEYNFWANDQFILRLREQEEAPNQILQLMSHIFSAHQVWLDRINGKEASVPVWGDIKMEHWEELNIDLYRNSIDILRSHPLEELIHYANSRGDLFENSLADLFHHLINHSTHHRAQVSLLMRQNQILPPASDYIFYLRRS